MDFALHLIYKSMYKRNNGNYLLDVETTTFKNLSNCYSIGIRL